MGRVMREARGAVRENGIDYDYEGDAPPSLKRMCENSKTPVWNFEEVVVGPLASKKDVPYVNCGGRIFDPFGRMGVFTQPLKLRRDKRNLAIPQLLRSSTLGQSVSRYERQPDRVPAQGTFTPSVHAHVRRTPSCFTGRRVRLLFPCRTSSARRQ